jgi:hypothetical protein
MVANTISGVTLTNAGSGYTSAPTITLYGGGTGGIVTATITGTVTGVVITNGGSLYATAPTVSFTGGGGASAAGTATVPPLQVSGVDVTNPGKGYVTLPTVTFSGGGASVQATGTVVGGAVQLWPQMFPVALNLVIHSEKMSCEVASNSRANQSEDGSGSSAGTGASIDYSPSVTQMDFPPTLHGAITLPQSTVTVTGTAEANASQSGSGGTVPAQIGPVTVSATGTITPTVIPPTIPPAIPSKGLYAYTIKARNADDEYIMYIAEVINARDLTPH